MFAILSLLLVVSISILITRIATIALTRTGLSREAARFQARSAFTGAGFTTVESEKVVNHPVRRRIVMMLMLLGNAGIVTAVSSLMLTFIAKEESSTSVFLRVVLLVGGVLILWMIATSEWVDKHLSRFIDYVLNKYTTVDVRDYAHLMHLSGDYRLAEIGVQEGNWLEHKALGDAQLRDEGIVVLGISRADGSYIGTPDGDTIVEANDTLLVYSRQCALEALDTREPGWRGDYEHREAVSEQEQVKDEERAPEPAETTPSS